MTLKLVGYLEVVHAMRDVVGAVVFLLENRSVNAANLAVDCGILLR